MDMLEDYIIVFFFSYDLYIVQFYAITVRPDISTFGMSSYLQLGCSWGHQIIWFSQHQTTVNYTCTLCLEKVRSLNILQ